MRTIFNELHWSEPLEGKIIERLTPKESKVYKGDFCLFSLIA